MRTKGRKGLINLIIMEILTDKNERNIGTFKATEHLLQINVVRQFFSRAN